MAKQMMKLTVEEVRANIPYDLICMVRYGCTWSSGRRRRAWLADFSESEREAAGHGWPTSANRSGRPQGGCSAWLTTGRSAGAFPIPCR